MKNKLVMANWITAISGIVVISGMMWAYRKILPPEIPLWYSRPWGEEQLAKPVSMGVVSIGIGVVAILAELTRRLIKDDVLAENGLACAIVTEIILVLGALRIIMLVI